MHNLAERFPTVWPDYERARGFNPGGECERHVSDHRHRRNPLFYTLQHLVSVSPAEIPSWIAIKLDWFLPQLKFKRPNGDCYDFGSCRKWRAERIVWRALQLWGNDDAFKQRLSWRGFRLTQADFLLTKSGCCCWWLYLAVKICLSA